jgi:hypothetical protein
MAIEQFPHLRPIVTLAQARAAGLRRYFTGCPCPYGHVDERSASQAMCVVCSRLRANAARKTKKRRAPWKLPKRITRTAQLKDGAGDLSDELRRKIISRVDAKARGMIFYFTGQPCRHGHVSQHYVSSKRCLECDRTLSQEIKNTYRRNRKERRAGRAKPEHCEVCGEKAKVVFDHCHQHGHFRGWICDACNRTLCAAQDNSARLRSLAVYLDRDREKLRGFDALSGARI